MKYWQDLKETVKWLVKPASQKAKLLEQAVDLLRLDPETYALYEDAVRGGVTIHFDSDMIGGGFGGIFSTNEMNPKGRIRLKPRENVHHLAEVLAHELRHAWQYRRLELTPETWFQERVGRGVLSLVFNRLIEADAYAFQTRFCHMKDEQIRLTRFAARLLERQQEREGCLTEEHIAAVNKVTARECGLSRAEAGRKMSATFHDYLFSPLLSQTYDVPLALRIHDLHAVGAANDNAPQPRAITALRRILAEENLRPLMKGDLAVEREFNAAVLRHVDVAAGALVRLSEQFNAARKAKNPEEQRLRQVAMGVATLLRK